MGTRSRSRAFAALALSLTGCSVISSFDGFGGADAGSTNSLTDASASTARGPDGEVVGTGPGSGDEAGSNDDGSTPVSTACPPSPDPALIAYYRFEEGKGQKAIDCSGKGNDGTIQGGATFRAGKNGGGLQFNGTSTCLDIGEGKGAGLGALTVGAWVSVTDYAYGTTARYIVAKTTDAELRGWRFGTDQGGTFSLKVGRATAAGGTFEATTPAGNPTGKWIHAAAVYTANGDVTVWVDGKKVKTAPSAPAIVEDGVAHLRVGCFTSNTGQQNYHLSGTLDDVRIYSRALSDAEMEALPTL